MAALRRRRALGNDRGAELIELAIVLPLLLLVFAAIIDFGFLFQRYEVLVNAAREGARLGVLEGYTQTDVDARVAAYLQSAGLTVTGDPTDVAYSNVSLPGGRLVRVVTVTVTYPAEFLNLGPFASFVTGGTFSTINLKATSAMRTEVQGAAGS